VRPRWIVFLSALAGSAVLAVTFALAVDALTRAGPAPVLTSVPLASLTRAGYSVAAAPVPPYCGLQAVAADRQWLPAASGGCPISRADAEAAAAPEPGPRALEAVLARVSSSRSTAIGRDRLIWLVAVRRNAMILPLVVCGGPAVLTPCPPRVVGASTVVVFVDAISAQPLEVLPAGSYAMMPAIRPLQPSAGSG
jgi:hypothetical protein